MAMFNSFLYVYQRVTHKYSKFYSRFYEPSSIDDPRNIIWLTIYIYISYYPTITLAIYNMGICLYRIFNYYIY